MERADYFVVLHEGDWHIRFNGKLFGPLRTEREAIQIATTAPERAAANRVSASVFAQEVGGVFRQWPTPSDAAAGVMVAAMHSTHTV